MYHGGCLFGKLWWDIFVRPKICSNLQHANPVGDTVVACKHTLHGFFFMLTVVKNVVGEVHSVLINVLGCEIPLLCTVLYLGHISAVTLKRDQ